MSVGMGSNQAKDIRFSQFLASADTDTSVSGAIGVEFLFTISLKGIGIHRIE
jgi:hypothetical protein